MKLLLCFVEMLLLLVIKFEGNFLEFLFWEVWDSGGDNVGVVKESDMIEVVLMICIKKFFKFMVLSMNGCGDFDLVGDDVEGIEILWLIIK